MSQEQLIAHYERLQSNWTVVDRFDDYGFLVTPTGNNSEPLHRWFHLKEAYSSFLLERLFKDAEFVPNGHTAVFDPFCGSGTTLLSAIELAGQERGSLTISGIERNPFIYILARAKIAAATRGKDLARVVSADKAAVVEAFHHTKARSFETASTTLNNTAYFPPLHVRDLLALASCIDSVEDDDSRDILRVCLGAAIEPAGRLRRDGRALRIVPEREPQAPLGLWRRYVLRAIEDLEGIYSQAGSVNWSVQLGDARSSQYGPSEVKYDWIVCSPPYPNNIDYTEVYKLENWVLGSWRTDRDMKAHRLQTLRSHPSVRFPEAYSYESGNEASEVESLICPIVRVIPADRYYGGRLQLIKGYADDMLTVFKRARARVSDNGRMVFVVGNSHHGNEKDGYVIAADLVLARLAELAGWTVEEVRIARPLRRRGGDSEFMRESIVVLTPKINHSECE